MPKQARIRTVAAVLTATALAVTACSSQGSGGHGTSGKTDVSVMDIAGSEPAVIMQYAHAQGIDAANGLNFKFVGATSGPAMQAAIVSGSVDFSDGGSLGFPLVKKGSDLLWLLGELGPSFEVVVHPNTSTPHLGQQYPAPVRDLKGLKVGVTALGSIAQLYLDLMLKDAGLSSAAATPIAVGGVSTSVAAFKSGRIDALVTFAPMEELIGTNNLKVLVPTVTDPMGASPFPDWTLNNIATTTKSYANAHPKTVAAFCTTMAQSIKQLKDPSYLGKVLPVVEQSMQLSPKQASEMWKKYSSLLKATITEQDWKAQVIGAPPADNGYVPPYSGFVDQKCQQIVASIDAG